MSVPPRRPDMRFLLFAVLAASLAGFSSAERDLPSSWKKCKTSDPDIDSCLKDAINQALSSISVTGLKEFKLLPIEPFKISELTITQGSGPVTINLILKNVVITGLKDFRFKSIKSDLNRYLIKGSLQTLPLVSLIGNYQIEGRLLLLPISGQGKCELIMKNLNSDIDIFGAPMNKSGLTYMNVKKFYLPLYPELFIIKFENLFNGNKWLGDRMNKFMNDNWQVILREVQPALTQGFGLAWAETSNRIFHRVPFNKIFLDK